MAAITRRSFLFALGGFLLAAPAASAIQIGGIEYMSLAQLASLCGMRYKTLVKNKTQEVYSKHTRMTFNLHSRSMNLNGMTVYLGHAVALYKGVLQISKRDYLKTIIPIVFPQNLGKPPKLFSIFIDAGHGGKDFGAQNKALKISEKNVALDIAARLGRELEKNGYKVSYTRTKDNFVELADRPKKANSAKADLFLSIHCNAAGDKSVRGVETYSLTPRWMPSTASAKMSKSDSVEHPGNSRDGWNKLLAYYIQRDIAKATRSPDRGIKKARFAVLKTPNMPSVLIETGFISNNTEGKLLATPAYRQKIASAICAGVMTYHNSLRRLAKK